MDNWMEIEQYIYLILCFFCLRYPKESSRPNAWLRLLWLIFTHNVELKFFAAVSALPMLVLYCFSPYRLNNLAPSRSCEEFNKCPATELASG